MAIGITVTIREVYRGLRAKRWLAAAMTVEFLSLAGAISTIPSWGLLPAIWALAAVGILSTLGVLIITAHFILEYNRRPLNEVQKLGVEKLLSGYLPVNQAQVLASKSELSKLVKEPQLFWLWQYQNSVIQLAWATDELQREPGTVLVAELIGAGSQIPRVEFSMVPPPVPNVGKCLTDTGEKPPQYFMDWGTIFNDGRYPAVFYSDSNQEIRYLRLDRNRVAFDDRLCAPVIVPSNTKTTMPVLMKTSKKVTRPLRDWPYEWGWALQIN